MDPLIIFCRKYLGTYIARCSGKTASCTVSPKIAAERVAEKVMAVKKHHLREMTRYAYEIIEDTEDQ